MRRQAVPRWRWYAARVVRTAAMTAALLVIAYTFLFLLWLVYAP